MIVHTLPVAAWTMPANPRVKEQADVRSAGSSVAYWLIAWRYPLLVLAAVAAAAAVLLLLRHVTRAGREG